MKKILIVLAMVCLFAVSVEAADVRLRWDPVAGATGYKVYMSVDDGATWAVPKDVGNVLNYTYVGVSDTTLVLFKLGAYKAGSETICDWYGAWWDSRKMPLTRAIGLGVAAEGVSNQNTVR